MKSVAFHNLGCKVNAYETEIMQQNLMAAGFTIVDFNEKADIYIINTCSVTNIADRKSRQMLHRAKAMNPEAVVVAVGCYVQTAQEKVEKDECIDLAIGNNLKNNITEILLQYLEKRDKNNSSQGNLNTEASHFFESDILDIGKIQDYEDSILERTAEHTRAYIKIQDGCNQFCTYCIIPYARGRVRSRKPEDVLHEIEGLVQEGYSEVVITGIHLSSYGIDFEEKITSIRDYMETTNHLPELLEQIQRIEGLQRIRLGSLEPRIITDQFTQRLRRITKLCPHFHLSLQSGCDDTLIRMNRHYTTQEYKEKVALLREIFPGCAVTTDVIVGFPGETDEEFMTTRDYLSDLKLYEMHIFKYSRRKGTKADTMPMQLTEAQKEARSALLLEDTAKNSCEFRKQFIGKSLSVLFEEVKTIDQTEYMIGYSKEYIPVGVMKKGDGFLYPSRSIFTVIPDSISSDGKYLLVH